MTTTDLLSEDKSVRSSVSKRQMIENRKEKERLEDEANYTFTPKVKELKKAQSPREKERSRFDKLYSEAVKKNLNLKEKGNSKIVSTAECPFKPYITTKGASSRGFARERTYSISRPKTAPTGIPVNNPDPEARFHPIIPRRSLSIEREYDRKAFCDRLYLHSKVLKEKFEKVQKEKAAAELDQCTFSPRIPLSPRSRSSSRGRAASAEPRYHPSFPDRQERLVQNRNKKIEEMAQMKMKNDMKDLTFKPQLSKGSQRLSARGDKPAVPVHERLISAGSSKDLHLIAAKANAENTFKPQLVTNFKTRASLSPLRAPLDEQISSIHERLYKLGELKQK